MTHSGQSLSQYLDVGDLLIGRYRIEDVAGSGAFGAIFSAIDQQSGERVAVKALPPETEQVSDTALARFRREMKVISKLIHRNIVGLYDYGQTPAGVFFMILEYVDGLPLDHVVRGRPMEAEDALDVSEQISSALQLAHHNGVVHRDLKPANIMVSGQPGGYRAKVLDFGMAKLLSRIDDESIIQLTREGMAVGTPRYIAPEQARGEQVGSWTDLYALGLLIYEMFTGARAVKADDVEGAVSAHVSPEPLVLEEVEQIPERYRPLIFGLIEKDPQRRFRRADDVLGEIDGLRFHNGETRPVFDPQRGRVERSQTDGESAGEPATGSEPASAGSAPRRGHDDARPHENLELDEDARRRPGSSTSHAPLAQRQSPAQPWFRTPDKPGEWVEASIAPLVCAFGALLLTAPLRSFSYDVRLGIAALPLGLALGWALLSGRKDWRYSFFRLLNLFSLGAALIAHALGPRELVVALYRNPDWIVAPIRDVPGMDSLGLLLTWIARLYATVLGAMLDWGFDVIG